MTAVAQVVHDAIAGDSNATQLNGSPVVNCTEETSCTISYTLQEPTGGLWDQQGVADLQLIEPTRQVWKALFYRFAVRERHNHRERAGYL